MSDVQTENFKTVSDKGPAVYPGSKVSLALIHWPILDRAGNVVVTNVTNFDIHDIARASTTYGLENYFIVNRLREQLMFVHRVLDHWRTGEGSRLNPKRKTALGCVQTAETLQDVIKQFPVRPLVISTDARNMDKYPGITYQELRTKIHDEPEKPILLVFGTGFGLYEDALKECDYLLEPIKSQCPNDYRHLSVRSAVSIILDRLLAKW